MKITRKYLEIFVEMLGNIGYISYRGQAQERSKRHKTNFIKAATVPLLKVTRNAKIEFYPAIKILILGNIYKFTNTQISLLFTTF